MSTLTDVARLAKVSTTTASHVINDTRPVSAAARERVLAAIVEADYAVNGLARALRRQRSDSIGLVVSDTSHPIFAELARGVEDESRSKRLTLLLANSAEDPVREFESLQALGGRRVDGVLVAPVAGSRLTAADRIPPSMGPVVLVDRLIASDLDQVGVENTSAMRRLVSHFVELGHRRIGILVDDLAIETLAERFDGYRGALEAAGIPFDERLVVEVKDGAAEAGRAAASMLASDDPPSALMSASTVSTIGALEAIRDGGWRIPEDVAFGCFDLPANHELFATRLTGVVQPAYEIGRQAMRCLWRRIEDPAAHVGTVRLTPSLLHGESCGCARGAPIFE
jgi:LacI family transcriptional regulator